MTTTSSCTEVLPRVLIVKRPLAMAMFGDRFFASPEFEILKAFESKLPLPEFLAKHSDHSVSAIIAPVAAPVTADLIDTAVGLLIDVFRPPLIGSLNEGVGHSKGIIHSVPS